jgi:predicted ester cyclase
MIGIHTGDFMGIPATGKTIRRAQITFFHIRDGKIADSYTVSDIHGMMHELQKA